MDPTPMDVQTPTGENGNNSVTVMETSSPPLADPAGIAELARTALDSNHISTLNSAQPAELGPSVSPSCVLHDNGISKDKFSGNGINIPSSISAGGPPSTDDVLQKPAPSTDELPEKTSQVASGNTSANHGGAEVATSVAAGTLVMPSNAVVFHSRATIEQLQHTVSLLEKERQRMQQQQKQQGLTPTDVMVCPAGATAVAVPPGLAGHISLSNGPQVAMGQNVYLSVPQQTTAMSTTSNIPDKTAPSAVTSNQHSITTSASALAAQARLSDVTVASAAHSSSVTVPIMMSQPVSAVQTVGQTSAGSQTSAPSTVMPGTASGTVLSFQQPFLVLPPMPPIDQQPAQQHLQVYGKRVLAPKQSTRTRGRPSSGSGSVASSHPALIAPAPPTNLSSSQHLFSTLSQVAFLQQVGGSMLVQPKVESAVSATASDARGSSDGVAMAGRQRKPCNCSKSQCLKLYCECFANGEFCHDCNCQNCHNNIEHEAERSAAIKACLERNPHAFHPKIGKSTAGKADRRHNKGCHCRRSGCLKNYCECYEAKIPCTSLCRCIGCKNYEESPDRKSLLHLATAADLRTRQQNAARKHLSSQIQEAVARPPPCPSGGERLACSLLTEEVINALCKCWMERASEERVADGSDFVHEVRQEVAIIDEVGRCLKSIIAKAGSARRRT